MSAVKLEREVCEHARKLCFNLDFMYECKAPKDFECPYINKISDGLVLCKKYNSLINKILSNIER